MMNNLSIPRVGGALTVLGVVTYAICFAWHALADVEFADNAFVAAFPGFSWTVAGFLVGLGWTIVYSVYTAVVFVSAYDVLGRLGAGRRVRGPRQPAP